MTGLTGTGLTEIERTEIDLSGPTKFDELRLRTAAQLIGLIERELDAGLRAAGQGLHAEGKPAESPRRLLLEAKRVENRAARLLRVAHEITPEESARLHAKHEQLREMTAALAVVGSGRTEESVAALARGLWAAQGHREGNAQQDWFRAEEVLRSAERSRFACCGR